MLILVGFKKGKNAKKCHLRHIIYMLIYYNTKLMFYTKEGV